MMAGYNYGYNQYPTYNTYPQYQQGYPQYPQMQNVSQPQQVQSQPMQTNQQLQNVQQIPQQTNQQQIQNGGFFTIRSREEAFNYPVAPGYSITFKDENSPRLYTKTKGFSSLEEPVFKSYLLIEEDAPKEETHEGVSRETERKPDYALKSDLQVLYDQLDLLRNELDFIKKSKKPTPKPKKQEPIVEVKEEMEEVQENE